MEFTREVVVPAAPRSLDGYCHSCLITSAGRRLERLLGNIGSLVEEAEGRHITNHHLLAHLKALASGMYRGRFALEVTDLDDASNAVGHDGGGGGGDAAVAVTVVGQRSLALRSSFNSAKRYRATSLILGGGGDDGMERLAAAVDELESLTREYTREFILLVQGYPRKVQRPVRTTLYMDRCVRREGAHRRLPDAARAGRRRAVPEHTRGRRRQEVREDHPREARLRRRARSRPLRAHRVVRDAGRRAPGRPPGPDHVGERRAGVPRRRAPHPRRAAILGGAVPARVRGSLARRRVVLERASVVPERARRREQAPLHVPRRRPRPARHGGASGAPPPAAGGVLVLLQGVRVRRRRPAGLPSDRGGRAGDLRAPGAHVPRRQGARHAARGQLRRQVLAQGALRHCQVQAPAVPRRRAARAPARARPAAIGRILPEPAQVHRAGRVQRRSC
ncbi:hypothetical protein PAHAL_4G026800 [Panicum hallii]|uniref:Rx N-terminal domain-containing protein n=1 Tax=Panicum hallii TaxID=206008 RepID=A0A2T8JBI7_9POAL|nr:hypothetical protein PAHAL_4G026800 [Panicum hallii]